MDRIVGILVTQNNRYLVISQSINQTVYVFIDLFILLVYAHIHNESHILIIPT